MKAFFLQEMKGLMDMQALRPLNNILQIGMDCMIWRATSGNGAMIGTSLIIIKRLPVKMRFQKTRKGLLTRMILMNLDKKRECSGEVRFYAPTNIARAIWLVQEEK